MTENKRNYILPIGSVVTLKHGEAQLMIAGRAQLFNNEGTIGYFDYAALAYPQGIVEANSYAFFNDEDIEDILFEGYRSVDEIKYANNYMSLVTNAAFPKLELDFSRESRETEKISQQQDEEMILVSKSELDELRDFRNNHDNIYHDTKAKIQKALKQIREMNQTIDSEWKGHAFTDYLKQYEELESRMFAFSNLLDKGDNLLREYEQENGPIRSNVLDITNAVTASVHDTKSLVDSTEAKKQMDELSKSGVATIANAGDVKSILNTDKSIKDFGSQN
ncbi:MAG: DUF4176 domain-containing protein [Streptococcaceae bacterium]|jgi:uncharacterized protein YukE|nr:DUF4176 domain-containing protein [Streptococcaceae bacterium]